MGQSVPLPWSFLFVLLWCQLMTATNVPSKVIDLSDKFLEVMDDGLWFVEFYAPWCGHCKRLAPIWEQVGHILADEAPQIRVGRVDCTRFSSVGSALDIRGFPTLKLFRNGKQISFDGDRTKDALVDFALKASGPEVRTIIGGVGAFMDVKKQMAKNGFFLLVLPEHADSTADSEVGGLTSTYFTVAKQMFTQAYFYQTTENVLPQNLKLDQVPAVMMFKDAGHNIFNPEKDGELSRWAQAERWPLFPLISYGNLHDIGTCCNKLLVLAVLDILDKKKPSTPVGKGRDGTIVAINEVKGALKNTLK